MAEHPDPSLWTLRGMTSNSRYFDIEPGILACVPFPGSSDTEATARENTRFQETYWIERDRIGVCIVFFDYLVDQTAAARKVYTTFPFRGQRATALVGGTALSRAIASFFMGLSVPSTKTRLFGAYPDALAWCRKLLAEEGSASP